MKIERNLNLVVPVESEAGTIYVHSKPISIEVFTRYARVMARSFSILYSDGTSLTAGPRIAAMIVRQEADAMGVREEVEGGLISEIYRLSNVIILHDGQWQTMPLVDAKKDGLIDTEIMSEVENAIVFFTLLWRMHTVDTRAEMLDAPLKLWGAELSSLKPMEYANSLQTSTPVESTGETVVASSIPS